MQNYRCLSHTAFNLDVEELFLQLRASKECISKATALWMYSNCLPFVAVQTTQKVLMT